MQRSTIAPATNARHSFRSNVSSLRADRLARADDKDWKLFVMSFTAFFVCFYTFIF